VDVRAAEIDILAAGGHKWLCGPFGTGFAYVRRELVAALEPPVAGWTAMTACADYSQLTDYRWEYVGDARRFEVATMPLQDVAGLTTSLGLLLETGVGAIREHIRGLVEPLARFVEEHPRLSLASDMRAERRSGIVAIRSPDLRATFGALHAAGVGCVPREGAIRLAPHLYNTADEVARVIEVLARSEGR
jgi:selenocysteine lyase/cysteine desulfurase